MPKLVVKRTNKSTYIHKKSATKPAIKLIPNAVTQPKVPLQQKIINIVNAPKDTIAGKTIRRIKRNAKRTYGISDITPQSVPKIKELRGKGKGKKLVIVANGPSISEIENIHLLKNKENIDTLTINTPVEKLWPTTHWAFFDRSQIRRHKSRWDSYNGVIFNSSSIKEQKETSIQFKNIGGPGFSKDITKGIHIGRSSVYASMQIALWMEYDKIYILGCDMDPKGINGQLHFYGENPDVKPKIRASRFDAEAKAYEYAADRINKEDREKFVFCSDYNKWKFVEKYSKLAHKDCVRAILE